MLQLEQGSYPKQGGGGAAATSLGVSNFTTPIKNMAPAACRNRLRPKGRCAKLRLSPVIRCRIPTDMSALLLYKFKGSRMLVRSERKQVINVT